MTHRNDRYRVDLGREIQGGIVLRLQNVPAAAAGQQFEVLLGETLMKNGSVLWKGMRTKSAPPHHALCVCVCVCVCGGGQLKKTHR